MATTRYNLDYNGLFPLNLNYDPATQTLKVYVERDANPGKRMTDAVYKLINCTHNYQDLTQITKTPEGSGRNTRIVFHPVPPEFTLHMGNEPFGKFKVAANGDLEISEHRPLTASQTRLIGTQHTRKAWLSETGMDYAEYDAMRALAKSAITTDFHTHSSGQISAKGLLKVAKAHGAYYPIHLLKDIGINRNFEIGHIRKEQRVKFPPLEPQDLDDEVGCVALSALSEKELKTLELHMSLRTDRQESYTDAENDAYRLRYPFTKNLDLLKDTIKEMARESLANGITYAEISFVGLDKPEILQRVHEAIWEMEEDPELKAFSLRLKHGIPRTFSREQFIESLEKAKVLLQSPYITGIDVLGYEVNKTNEFYTPLDDFAKWLKDHYPKKNLCVHAGENDKNPNNVRDALELAEKHDLYLRIGHGLYGLEGEALEIAKRLCANAHDPKVHIEANPISNIALNNISHESKMPFRRMLDHGIPFIVSSDSLGLYQGSAEQLAVSLLHAGFSRSDLEILKHHQDSLLERQRRITEDQKSTIKGWNSEEGRTDFLLKMTKEIGIVPAAKIPKHYRMDDDQVELALSSQGVELIREPKNTKKLPDFIKEKRMIGIFGASGASWKRLSPGHQREIAIAYDMLAHAIDPETAYIVQGRPKAEGVNDAINTALREAQKAGAKKTENVGLMTDNVLEHADYGHLTHMVRIKGQLDVADEIANFAVQHDGILIAAGGAAYTRDIIMKADRRMEKHDKGHLLLMDVGLSGASTEKAEDMEDTYKFIDGKSLLQRLNERSPGVLREEFRDLNDKQLRDLYNAAAERVNERYGMPSSMQQITGVSALTSRQRE
jgi:adenosine deaminase